MYQYIVLYCILIARSPKFILYFSESNFTCPSAENISYRSQEPRWVACVLTYISQFFEIRGTISQFRKIKQFISFINRWRIFLNYPSVTIVHTIRISTTVRLYLDFRQHNIHNPDIKQSLLLQYLSLIQQCKLAESWLGLYTGSG